MHVISFHLFEGAAHGKLRLLRAFGLLRIRLPRMDGVCFAKAMGCGRGAAFSILPDWARWAVMMECTDLKAEQAVIDSAPFRLLVAESKRLRSWRLMAFRKKGTWDGYSPFGLEADNGSRELAVLTRADISLTKVPAFIRHSRTTTHALEGAPGLRFSLGMGELPLLRQATFTIWKSDAAMTAYAYKNVAHTEAMRAKASRRLFGEEMFVRFRIAELERPIL